MLPRARGHWRKMGGDWQWAWGFFWGYKNILKLIVVIVAQLCKYTKKHLILYFKCVNCRVCKLHFKMLFKKKKLVIYTSASLWAHSPFPWASEIITVLGRLIWISILCKNWGIISITTIYKGLHDVHNLLHLFSSTGLKSN